MQQFSKETVPHDLRQILQLLNATNVWNTTIYIHADRIDIFDGDQLLFYATSMAEAEAFVVGCFLGTFPGKPVKQIKHDIMSGRYEDLYSDEAIAQIEREHIAYARHRIRKQQSSMEEDRNSEVTAVSPTEDVDKRLGSAKREDDDDPT